MKRRPALSLHARLSLLLSLLLALGLSVGIGLWLHESRAAIHEEIDSAGHVAEQWLTALIAQTRLDPEQGQARLVAALHEVGRVRAHALEISVLGESAPQYVSPPTAYKAQRNAPTWFATHLEPNVRTRHFAAGDLQISLYPDASRSILDAWDKLCAGAGWGVAAVLLCWFAAHAALRRVLAPLDHISAAFARGAAGRFDRRLLHHGPPELDRLVASYNQLAERLDDSLHDQAQVAAKWAADQQFNRTLQARLEAERQSIARELHDELAQGITAVRAIAGAIQQRSTDQPGIHSHAQAILAMTSHMQDGVRDILQRLRPLRENPHPPISNGLLTTLEQHCRHWARLYPQIELQFTHDPISREPLPGISHTALRLLQECLTNVARHAHARQVSVHVALQDDELQLSVGDDGCGLPDDFARHPRGAHFGLTGMQERVHALAGRLYLERAPAGGLLVRACLPLHPPVPTHADLEDTLYDTP